MYLKKGWSAGTSPNAGVGLKGKSSLTRLKSTFEKEVVASPAPVTTLTARMLFLLSGTNGGFLTRSTDVQPELGGITPVPSRLALFPKASVTATANARGAVGLVLHP